MGRNVPDGRSRLSFVFILYFAVALLITLLPCAANAAGPKPQWVLHDFPAHRTDLTRDHHKKLGKIHDEIVTKRISCIRLIGHAATWKGISDSEYHRRALFRARNAAEELVARLEMVGLISKIFLPEDDLGLPDEVGCETISGIDVIIVVGEDANNRPLKPNLVTSSNAEARGNRAFNRRVEVFLDPVISRLPAIDRPADAKVPPCPNEPGAVCVVRKYGAYEGLYCWHPGTLFRSADELDDLVAAGNATYLCDSR